MKKWAFAVCIFLLPVLLIHAQEIHQDLKEIITADIVEVLSEEERDIPGTDTSAHVQKLQAKITSGSKNGETIIFENELVRLYEGDVVYLYYVKTIDDFEYFIFKDYQRHTELIILALFFVALLLFFARWQGARALFALGVSIIAIVFLLIPLLLKGYNPALVSLFVASIVLAVVLFLTHGFTVRSTIAYFGTVSAVLLTCIIAWVSVSTMRLNGFGNDASVSLNFATYGTLDFAGLLLGGIIIGILGLLDDVAVTQVSVVQQLKHANASLTASQLYTRAIVALWFNTLETPTLK